MSRSGASNVRGIRYQNWAAIYMFLESAPLQGFKGIRLEDKKWQDFTLLYEDRKIICEAKNHKKPLSYAGIREILESLATRHDQIIGEDRVVIVCRQVSKRVAKEIKILGGDLDFGDLFVSREEIDKIEAKFRKRKFGDPSLKLLQRLQITTKDIDQLKDRSMEIFWAHPCINQLWIPRTQAVTWFEAVFCDEFLNLASKGDFFNRRSLESRINELANSERRRNSYYEDVRGGLGYGRILELIDSGGLEEIENEISQISSDPDTIQFLFRELSRRKDQLFKDWRSIWSKLFETYSPYLFVNLRNIHPDDLENSKGMLEFVDENIEKILANDISGQRLDNMMTWLRELIKKHENLAIPILSLVEKITNLRPVGASGLAVGVGVIGTHELDDLLGRLHQSLNKIQGTQHPSQIGQLLSIIEKSNLSKAIFSSSTQPRQTFNILRDYLKLDFEKNWRCVVKKFAPKHLVGYTNTDFNSGRSQAMIGPPIIDQAIGPALDDYYKKDQPRAQRFLKQVFTSSAQESLENYYVILSAINILLGGLNDETQRGFSTELLDWQNFKHKDKLDVMFLGIAERIIQVPDLSDNDKWDFAITPHIKNTPGSLWWLRNSPIKFDFVFDLAKKNNEAAADLIKRLFDNYQYGLDGGIYDEGHIGRLLGEQAESPLFELGVKFLDGFISDYLESDHQPPPHIHHQFQTLIAREPQRGLKIIQQLIKNESRGKSGLPQRSQELALWPLARLEFGQDNQRQREVLKEVFEGFVRPLLEGPDVASKAARLQSRFSCAEARESLVHFTDQLTEAGLLAEAFELIEILSLDPSPESESSDSGSGLWAIRSQAANSLTKLLNDLPDLPNVKRFEFLDKALAVVGKLINDEVVSVQIMSLNPLGAMIINRYTTCKSGEGFMTGKQAQEATRILFVALEDNRDQPQLLERLELRVCDVVDITKKQIGLVCEIYRPKGPNLVATKHLYRFLIYLAHERKGPAGPTMGCLRDFLHQCIEEGSHSVRRELVQTLTEWVFQIRDGAEKNRQWKFDVANRYLALITKQPYDLKVFWSMRHIIYHFFDIWPERLYRLWLKIATEELEYLNKKPFTDRVGSDCWEIPFDNYKQMFGHIIKMDGDGKKYLDILSKLMDYPQEWGMFDYERFEFHSKNLRSIDGQGSQKLAARLKELFPKFALAR